MMSETLLAIIIAVVIVVLVLLLLAAIWFFWLRPRKSGTPPAAEQPPRVESVAVPVQPVAAPVVEVAPPLVPDDLKRIEGIGPKIADLLQSVGILTFAQLAATDVARLEELLQQAGLRIADPSTWAEQARLAAVGDWEGLAALQENLKGGRRV